MPGSDCGCETHDGPHWRRPHTVLEYAALLEAGVCPLCLQEGMGEDELGGWFCENCHAPEGTCPRPGCGGLLEGWDWPERMPSGRAWCSEDCNWPGPLPVDWEEGWRAVATGTVQEG